VSKLITFPPTSWLLLPWQASPHGKVREDAANPVISRPGRLCTSEISILLLVCSAVAHHCHHRPALPFRDWHPFTKPVLILSQLLYLSVSPFCTRSRGLVLKPQNLPNQVDCDCHDVFPTGFRGNSHTYQTLLGFRKTKRPSVQISTCSPAYIYKCVLGTLHGRYVHHHYNTSGFILGSPGVSS